MLQQCFVCAEHVDGDADYFEHHLNQCLDGQANIGSSTAMTRLASIGGGAGGSSSGAHESTTVAGKWSSNRFPNAVAVEIEQPEVDQFEADALLATALASQMDAEEEQAEQESRQASEALVRRLAAEEEAHLQKPFVAECPVCLQSWEMLQCTSDERDGHVEMCSGGDNEQFVSQKQVRPSPRKQIVLGIGKADIVRGTSDLIPLFAACLNRSHKNGRTKVAYLCSPAVEHVYQGWTDMWSCGYRNIQMIFSSLREMDCYAGAFNFVPSSDSTLTPLQQALVPLPTIAELQGLIEDSWKLGFDPPSALHFNHKLRGSRKWIGTAEAYTALTSLGIRAQVVDFPKSQGSEGTHAILVKWILNYFQTPLVAKRKRGPTEDSDNDENPPVEDALSAVMGAKGTAVHLTGRQPLYLQHQGHSRTVIGLDQGHKGEIWLLVYDPGKVITAPFKKAAAALPNSQAAGPASKRARSVASVSPVAPEDEHSAFWKAAPGKGQIWPKNDKPPKPDLDGYIKLLEGFRIDLKSLSRRQEYQILYVQEGRLSPAEVTATKEVNSFVCK